MTEAMTGAAARVANAFAAVPRAGFLPPEQQRHAGADQPLPIGHGQTNSQPAIVRRMLELLDVRPGQRVLDVGAGSGWTTALLVHLVGPAGRVLGVERLPDLVALGRSHLQAHLDEPAAARLRGRAWLEQSRPGVLGLPEHGPYDRVLVSAAAQELPTALVDQLAPGGVLVAPVAGRLVRVVRAEAGDTEDGQSSPTTRVEQLDPCRFVPLVLDP